MTRVITTNRKARHDYTVVDTIEAGIALLGSEVKSCLSNEVSISESYCIFRNGEMYMMQSNIASYAQSSYMNHDCTRERKILLHKNQLRKLKAEMEKASMAVIPLDMHFSDKGKIKVLIGICRGKNAVDKRDAIKERESKIELKRMAR